MPYIARLDGQSVGQLASQSVSQSASEPASQPASQTDSQTATQSTSQPVSQWISHTKAEYSDLHIPKCREVNMGASSVIYPASTRHRGDVRPMLGQSRKRWTNIGTTLRRWLLFSRDICMISKTCNYSIYLILNT